MDSKRDRPEDRDSCGVPKQLDKWSTEDPVPPGHTSRNGVAKAPDTALSN